MYDATDLRPLKTGISSVTRCPDVFLHKFKIGATTGSTLPPSWDQSLGLTEIGMMGNATYGCCVEADFFHGEMFKALVAFNNGVPEYEVGFKPASQEFVEDIYFDYGHRIGETGKRPDQGSDPAKWAAYAIATKHTEFSAELDAVSESGTVKTVDLAAIFQACIDFRGVALTINCPTEMQQEFFAGQVLSVSPTNQPDPWDGHGIWLCAFDQDTQIAKIATWGKVVQCTFEFLSTCVTSVWVFGTKQDALAAGYDFTAWEQAAQSMTNFLNAQSPTPSYLDTLDEPVAGESLISRVEDAIKGVPGEVKEFIHVLHKASDAAMEREAEHVIEQLLADALKAYTHGVL